MAIAFSCPECGKQYKVKDELAGKPVTCKSCSAPIRVPSRTVAASVPSPEVESLAVEALVESAADQANAPPDEFEFECPNCIETVKLDVKFAGKQAQCPNCKRVIRVPQLTDPKARNWRAADHRPTLAKHVDDPHLAGAWGNTTTTSVVSRDALAEADALRNRRIKPGLISKTRKIVIVGLAGLAILIGVVLYLSHRTTKHRDDFMQKAITLANETTSPSAVAAEVCRAAAEYKLRDVKPMYSDANRLLKEAHEKFTPADLIAPEKSLDRLLVLTEVVLTQAKLGGEKPQKSDNDKLEWDKLQTDLRRTMSVLVLRPRGSPMPEGITMAYERLARSIGLGGGKSPAILGLLGNNVFPNSEDRIEPMAGVALELAALGETGRAKAKELAAQASGFAGTAPPSSKLIALHIMLDLPLPQAPPPGEGEPQANIRWGYAEGLARRGEIDRARSIARLPGRFEDRFAATVLVAASVDPAAANPDLAACVDLLENELGKRDLPDWPLIRLAQSIGRAPSSPVGGQLFAFLQKQEGLSPRSQAVRAWAQYELLRSGAAPISEAIVQAMTPEHAAGVALAWEALGRHLAVTGGAASTVDGCPQSMRTRPLALAGIALGLLDYLTK
jgi:DNA-directed RNA polymerase subunit M/transcription elongation factor TFIIS